MAEWLKATDCKSVLIEYGGSNPPLPTILKITGVTECGAFNNYYHKGEIMRQIKVEAITPQIEITGEQAKHLIYSLRSKSGEQIAAVDEGDQRALIELVDFTKDKVIAKLIKVLPPRTREEITLAVAVPKRGLDEIIRQATEIGIYEIQPLLTERTVSKPSTSKQERWQRIAKEAAEQSGAFEPLVKPLVPLKDFLSQVNGQIIFCNENEENQRINDVKQLSEGLTIVVGCEGGFSDNEIKIFESSGAISITLGENILRVDTAAIMALSIVKFMRRDFFESTNRKFGLQSQ